MAATLKLWLIGCLQQQHYISVIDSAKPAFCLSASQAATLCKQHVGSCSSRTVRQSTQVPARRVKWHQIHLAQSRIFRSKYRLNMPALQRLFERAVNHRQTRQSPLLWRCYLAYELHRGRPESARRIMLRAVHACTWCKALWLDGIQALAHQVSRVQEL